LENKITEELIIEVLRSLDKTIESNTQIIEFNEIMFEKSIKINDSYNKNIFILFIGMMILFAFISTATVFFYFNTDYDYGEIGDIQNTNTNNNIIGGEVK